MKNSEIRGLSTPELIERIETESVRYKMMGLNHAISDRKSVV